MKHQNIHKNVVVKQDCHSRSCRAQYSGIFHVLSRCRYKQCVITNLIWNLQRLPLSFLNNLRGKSHIKYGMTPLYNNGAFSLIELLVVVLIIGILAAVAVPQYQFAVDKARLMPYAQKISDILKAERVYYLANGEYTSDLTALDIDMTKICDTLGGDNNNIVYDCPGGIGIKTTTDHVRLYYCAEKNAHCDDHNDSQRYLMASWKLTGEFYGCNNYWTARGEKLCNYFTQQFGTN